MSFRVKLRIKSVRPLRTDPALLQALVEAARAEADRKRRDEYADMPRWPKGNECSPADHWKRSFNQNIQYGGTDTSFLWNGIDPINSSAVQ